MPRLSTIRVRANKLYLIVWVCTLLALSGCRAVPSIGGSFNQSIVFIGDSITARWNLPDYFGIPYPNRGISGQTAEQIAARFQNDVVSIKPENVVILAGTNDILAGTDLTLVHDTIHQMAQTATANGIRPIVCTIPPMVGHTDAVLSLNSLLKNDPSLQVTCDYYQALTTADGDLISGTLNDDGIHPSVFGYERMTVELDLVLHNLISPAP